MSDLHELLPEYALGQLPAEQAEQVDRALAEQPELRAALAAIEDSYYGLASTLPPLAPAPALRARLLASVQGERFGPFAQDLARYCDVALERARELLSFIDQPDRWEIGFVPGNFLLHFQGGPQALASDCGLVRLPAGFAFPKHRHLGPEVNYILEGRMIDDDGRSYGPGEAVLKGPEDVHSYQIGPERDCVLLAVQAGFEIVGDYDPNA